MSRAELVERRKLVDVTTLSAAVGTLEAEAMDGRMHTVGLIREKYRRYTRQTRLVEMLVV